MRARGRAYYVRRLEENYAVVLVLHPRAAFAVSERAMQEAIAGPLRRGRLAAAARRRALVLGRGRDRAPGPRACARAASRWRAASSPSR